MNQNKRRIERNTEQIEIGVEDQAVEKFLEEIHKHKGERQGDKNQTQRGKKTIFLFFASAERIGREQEVADNQEEADSGQECIGGRFGEVPEG